MNTTTEVEMLLPLTSTIRVNTLITLREEQMLVAHMSIIAIIRRTRMANESSPQTKDPTPLSLARQIAKSN